MAFWKADGWRFLELPMEREFRPGSHKAGRAGCHMKAAHCGRAVRHTRRRSPFWARRLTIHEGGLLRGAPDVGGYFLRLRLVEAHYDVPPVVTGIK